MDRVILGETVCSKRQHFIEPPLAEVVERLERGGKSLAFSSLALVTLERESRIVKELIETSDYPIEVNDLSAIGLIKGRRHLVVVPWSMSIMARPRACCTTRGRPYLSSAGTSL